MAAAKPDVNEMFEKMGQRLGWFKQKDLDDTLKVLSAKKKKPSKMRLQKQNSNTKPIIDNHDVKAQPKKTTKGIKSASDSRTKTINSISKVSSFKGILSSDSDLSDEGTTDRKKKSVPKMVLVVASDSEDEAPVVREDTYIECIGESPVNSSARPSIASSYEINPHRKSGDKDLYEETILKSRVSMATFSFDVDSIGDPLIESTRIHRRSSVSYNQFISPNTSEGKIDGTGSSDTSPYLQNPNKIKQNVIDKDGICEQLNNLTIQKSPNSNPEDVIDETECIESPLTSPQNNSRYVTAIDSLKDFDGQNDTIDTNKDKRKGSQGEASKETVNYNTKSRQGSENDSECEVEIVDTATQTSDIEDTDPESNHIVNKNPRHLDGHFTNPENFGSEINSDYDSLAQSNNILNAHENHRHLKSGCTETRTNGSEINSIYKNVTIIDAAVYENETVCRNASVDHDESMDTDSKLSEYEYPTVSDTKANNEDIGYNDHTEVEVDNVYNDTTRIKSSVSINTMSTISMTSTVNTDVQSANTSEEDVNLSQNSSEDSIVEVRDIATQTDPTLKKSQVGISENPLVNHEVDNVDQDHGNVSETSIRKNSESVNISEDIEDKVGDSDIADPVNAEEDMDNDKENYENEYSKTSTNGIDKEPNLSEGEFEEKATAQEDKDVNNCNESDMSNISINSADKSSEKGSSKGHSISSDNSSTTHKKSSANFSLLSSDSDSDDDGDLSNFSNIRKKLESQSTGQGTKDKEVSKGRNESQRSDNANQSWRTKKRYSSESSDDGDLEAFFQKLRKPEKEKSESEHSAGEISLDDFIVEDDDMSSESDDNAFYIRETQKMEEESLAERLKKNRGLKVNKISYQGSEEEEDDEVFSSKLYPDSVTKHKRSTVNKPKGTPRSWSLSSDSDSSNDTSPQLRQGNRPSNRKEEKPRKPSKTRGNVTKKMNFEDFSSSSDENENNEPLFKTPNPIRKTKKTSRVDKENSPLVSQSNGKKNVGDNGKGKTPKAKTFSGYISVSDDDSEDDSYQIIDPISSSTDYTSSTNVSGQDDYLFSKTPTPLSKGRQTKVMTPLSTRGGCTYSFLKSLSNVVEDESRRHPDAVRFVKNFKKTREELLPNLFTLYNRTVFEGKLPTDLPLVWNKRLLRTAGYCEYKKNRKLDDRTARVELSTKVCDSAERTRDTLVHEMCHAAVWLLNGVNGGHGPFWKYWARHANRVHPELPAIRRCHSYSINTKFTYRCTQCGYSIGRHSKSLNTEKKVCGYCRGKFQLIQNDTPTTPRSASSSSHSSVSNTPRTPNKFALFVKENYNTVKQKDKSLKHGDVMKELSKLFAQNKISNG